MTLSEISDAVTMIGQDLWLIDHDKTNDREKLKELALLLRGAAEELDNLGLKE